MRIKNYYFLPAGCDLIPEIVEQRKKDGVHKNVFSCKLVVIDKVNNSNVEYYIFYNNTECYL